MKLILSSLLLFYSLALPLSAFAASPTASLRTDKNRRFVYLTFFNIKGVSRVNYTLVYDTGATQKGVEGGFKTAGKSRAATRRQILGTCSSGRCVYHQGVRNLQLDVTYTLRSGGTVNVTKSLP